MAIDAVQPPLELAASTLSLAEAAHARVQSDPRAAAEQAEQARLLARARREPEAELAALHALGFARHELGDPRAVATLRAAVRVGERHGLERRAAMVRRPLAVYLAYRGQIAAAERELAAACAVLDAHELARTEVFRIAVLSLAGRAPRRLASSDRALSVLRRRRDVIWEARLLKNRGVLLAERGDVLAAEPDLRRARDLYARAGASEAAAGAEYELARIDLAAGDLPACLARLDAIDEAGLSAGHQSELELLRAQALVAGRLLDEARDALARAQGIWQRAGISEPEGLLEVVRLTLLTGDSGLARDRARRAMRTFAAQRRPLYRARATGLWLAACIAEGHVGRSALRSGRRASDQLAAAGSRAEALRIRLAVARAAAQLGSPVVARRELARVAPLRRRGPVADRIEACHVEALLCRSDGDDPGAQRAARRGLALLEEHRSALGAADLRVTVSEIGTELAALGLRIALDREGPEAILAWAERLRASALRLTPVTPPDGPTTRRRAAELRKVSAELQRAERAGRPSQALCARQATLERSIRRAARHAPGQGTTPAARRPLITSLADHLGQAALVELVEADGALTALTLVDGRIAQHAVGSAAAALEQLEWLNFGLSRLSQGGHGVTQRDALLAGMEASASALDAQLIAPVADVLGERPLIIVPTGSLHALPVAMLPSLGDRPRVVAPSAATWLALRARARRRQGRVALVCGPRLRHAAAEVAAIATLRPEATVLTGRRADAAAVMRAIDGASVVHLACHGRFRSDSPLFSSLELADGPLHAHELVGLRRAPDVVVLSACDLAVSQARPGDELLGFASALLAIGSRSVIASVAPVPDATAKRMMVAMHAELRNGATPSQALARAQSARRARDVALKAFICLGAG